MLPSQLLWFVFTVLSSSNLVFYTLVVSSALALPNQVKTQSTPVYRPPHLPEPAALARANNGLQSTALPTVTVRGFLNFRTTVDGTVIVFTPASAAESANNAKTPNLNTAPTIKTTEYATIQPTFSNTPIEPTKVAQPITTKKAEQTQTFQQQYPTGLVTLLSGSVVHNGATTVYETKVIGTYIDGKYAQIVQSSSKVQQAPSIQPTRAFSQPPPTASVLGPTIQVKSSVSEAKDKLIDGKAAVFVDNNGIQSSFKHGNLRSVSAALRDQASVSRPHSRQPLFAPGSRARWPQLNQSERKPLIRDNKDEKSKEENANVFTKLRRPARIGTRRFQLPPRQSPRVRLNRFKVKLPAKEEREESTSEAKDESKLQARIGQQRPQFLEADQVEQSLKQSTQIEPNNKSQTDAFLTVNLPLEPEKVVKEVQTITSEVTQHVNGNNIQISTVTLTTTIDRTLHPSEFVSEGMIAPTIPVEANDLEASTVHETPPLVISRTYSVTERSMRTTVVPVFDGTITTSHTVTESFFIRKLITAYKTMPPGDLFLLETGSPFMADSNVTTDLTSEENSIEPTLFQGALEITNEPDNGLVSATSVSLPTGPVMPTIDPSLSNPFGLPMNLNNQMPQFDLNNPLFLAAALQNPQLAAMYLGLQQLKQQQTQQQATHYDTITRPTTYTATDTIYQTKVVSFYDGRSTRSRTISEPLTTSERIVTTYTTEVTPVINPSNFAPFQHPHLQNIFPTQLVPPQFQMTPKVSTVTSSFTTVTDATSTKTKVYTLVYNAFSTKFRTVTSTSIFPTTVTITTTSTIPVANTAPFNYFG